jgi:RNA polymerase sigma-70 factor (ECF subfamily)
MAQVVTIREPDELESEEICKAMNLTSSNLWVLLHRARKHLRRCLEVHFFGRATV